jgi:hypothetical protein
MVSDKRGAQFERLQVMDTVRRRRWSEEEKLKIVVESFHGRRPVAATARRYGLSRSLPVSSRSVPRRVHSRGLWRRVSRPGFIDLGDSGVDPTWPMNGVDIDGGRLTARNTAEFALPVVEGRLGDPMLAAQIGYLRTPARAPSKPR